MRYLTPSRPRLTRTYFTTQVRRTTYLSQRLRLSSTMSSSAVHIFNPEGYPSLAPSYSHISVVPIPSTTRLVSFAGQTGSASTGDHPRSFPEQVRTALSNVDKCLAAAGVTKKDIVSNRQYVVKLTGLSAEDRKARSDIFLEWWRGTEGERLPPPDTLIGVDSLAREGILLEIEVTCVASLYHVGQANSFR